MARDPLMLVGVGASAGGLEAIERFFSRVESADTTSYVIIQHLSPDHKSLMGELLARHTTLPIVEVTDGLELESGRIYLMPRKSNVTVFRDRLFMSDPEPGLNLPIDIFFRSLADEYGEDSVGVILSGTGSDGTRGVRAIKEAGGVVCVQEESTAKFDGMPGSAIRTGIVDYVLPPEEMPTRIMRYALSRSASPALRDEGQSTAGGAIARILLLVKQRTGVDLSDYKETTLYRRIERRIGITNVNSVEDYLDLLNRQPAEITTLYKEILIGVTKFFRDADAFEVVRSRVIPEIVAATPEGQAIRVWVPGCSTGEEAYSIAILFAEYLEAQGISRPVRIFATDIDGEAIQFASAGVYPESIAADAGRERLQRYFMGRGERYQIAPEIRESVIFACHNVATDPPFRRVNLVSCRNLMIYLKPKLQQRVLSSFAFSLEPGGFLFLGSSETIGDYTRYFDGFDSRWKIFRGNEERPRRGEFRFPHGNRTGLVIDAGGIVDAGDTAVPLGARRAVREPSVEDAYGRILETVLPPSVLVTEERVVERVFGDVSGFLQLPSGRVDLNVERLVRDEYSIPLGTALQVAMRQSRPVVTPDIAVEEDGTRRTVSISVTPIQTIHGYRYLVSFGSRMSSDGEPVVADFTVEETVRQRIRDLETELQHSQENLRATIEELETSNEELQATNEELMSSNEELQSTNEELQSVNEELFTVNAEYQKKIEELSELNDDMDNLLAATPVGIIFLDRDRRIRKFTPAAAEQFRIIKTDLGRPIADLTHRLVYPEFMDDVRLVIDEGRLVEREIQGHDDRWFLVRILPYEEDDRSNGVVIALVDVTRRLRAERSGVRQNTLLMQVLDSNPVPILMVDHEGRTIYANDSSERLLGALISELELPYDEIRASAAPVLDRAVETEADDGSQVRLTLNGNPMIDERGNVNGAIFSIIRA